jgi:hypothetical protein
VYRHDNDLQEGANLLTSPLSSNCCSYLFLAKDRAKWEHRIPRDCRLVFAGEAVFWPRSLESLEYLAMFGRGDAVVNKIDIGIA